MINSVKGGTANSLWPNRMPCDAVLAQVTAWCLTTPIHYQNVNLKLLASIQVQFKSKSTRYAGIFL